jgi:cysteinyl-tRNA synthetase
MAVAQVRTQASPAETVAHPRLIELLDQFDAAISEDLNTAVGLTLLEEAASMKKVDAAEKLTVIARMDAVLGLNLLSIDRTDLRVQPTNAQITAEEIDHELTRRKEARAAKDFATSDAIRDALLAKGVDVMDGDPLGWDWKIDI